MTLSAVTMNGRMNINLKYSKDRWNDDAAQVMDRVVRILSGAQVI